MPFIDSLDIANRACDHLGVNQILSVTEDSDRNNVLSEIYDKVRRAELRRNAWRFAIKKCVLRPVTTTMLKLAPNQWSTSETYMQGEIVADANNCWWVSLIADNLNNTPGGNNEAWDMYFGPRVADVWQPTAGNISPWSAITSYITGNQVVGSDGNVYTAVQNSLDINPVTDAGIHWLNTGLKNTSTTGYYAGEIVYIVTGTSPNGYALFMSLMNGNTDTPNVTEPWSNVVQYNQDQIVSYNGMNWRSLLPINVGNTPSTPAAAWGSTITYMAGLPVTGSDNFTYTAVQTSTGVNPVTDNGTFWTLGGLTAWQDVPSIPAQDTQWRYLNVQLTNLMFTYPIGAGPSTQYATNNVFPLPANYIGPAPQNPKQGVMTFLGGPSGNNQPDWVFEGDFIVSSWAFPIVFRFVADVSLVRKMDDMFCEGLAARLAGMACKRITGSTELLSAVSSEYRTFMGEARTRNMIEQGTIEPYEDEYVTVRI